MAPYKQVVKFSWTEDPRHILQNALIYANKHDENLVVIATSAECKNKVGISVKEIDFKDYEEKRSSYCMIDYWLWDCSSIKEVQF